MTRVGEIATALKCSLRRDMQVFLCTLDEKLEKYSNSPKISLAIFFEACYIFIRQGLLLIQVGFSV
jgi:hypothetical protein